MIVNVDHELIDLTSGEMPPELFPNLGAWLSENN